MLGKRYRVLDDPEGYDETGLASYYGNKFHGRRTSNQEVYDMYAFTAAHKTLPLPSFARVTNLDNGKSIVVRVNDRGPFHDGRVIDLSYAAAVKLGIADQAAPARVEVRALTPADIGTDDAAVASQAHAPGDADRDGPTGRSRCREAAGPLRGPVAAVAAAPRPRPPATDDRVLALRHAPGRSGDAAPTSSMPG